MTIASIYPFVLTLLIGSVGGFLFSLMGLPAAWLSGAMVLVAATTLSGVRTAVPDRVRDTLFIVLGAFMGTGVSPEVIDRIGEWPWTMLGLVIAMVMITGATYIYLQRRVGWDRETAFFGSIPGALSFVLALAANRNADISRIATSQMVRLFILVALLPIVITSTSSGDVTGVADAGPMFWEDGLVLFGLCAVSSFVAVQLNVPGGWMTGAFFMSAALNASGLVSGSIPPWVIIPCYIALGSMIGCRFGSTSYSQFFAMLKAGLVAISVGLSIACACAWLGAVLLDLPFGQLLLAYAPGGLEVMTLMAFMLDLDPAFVAAHQIVRFTGMALLLPLITGFLFDR